MPASVASSTIDEIFARRESHVSNVKVEEITHSCVVLILVLKKAAKKW